MHKRQFSLWDLGSLVALGGLVTTGMWASFERVGASTILAVVFHFGLAFIFLKLGGWPVIQWPHGLEFRRRFVWVPSILLIIPLAYILLRTWNFDFPLSGDHDHHLLSALSAVEFWSRCWIYLLAFSILIFGAAKVRLPWLWSPLICLAMMIASHWAPPLPQYFLRYPATTYLFDVPMVSLAHALNLNSIWGVCRVINFLAPVVWLLLLRPYFFGNSKSMGWWILAGFILLQRDFLIVFDSLYLESWSVIFLLLALEAVLDEATPAWWAPLFAGVACIFKDSAAIPFLIVGLASVVRERRRPREMFAVLGAGSLSVLPFTVYYLARRESEVWRTIGVTSWEDSLTLDRFAQLWFRLQYQFHTPGLIALALLIVILLCHLFIHRQFRPPSVVLFLGGCAEFALFFVDDISRLYVGLPRLLFMPWLMILAPVFGLKGRAVPVLALMVGLCQLPALVEYLQSLEQPAYAQNFSEDYNVPYHYPIRTLMERGKRDLTARQIVIWVLSNSVTYAGVFPETYRDLMQLYDWRVLTPQTIEGHCRCSPNVAFLIMTTPPRNIRSLSPLVLSSEPTSQMSEACLAEFERTCRCLREGDPVEGRLCVPR